MITLTLLFISYLLSVKMKVHFYFEKNLFGQNQNSRIVSILNYDYDSRNHLQSLLESENQVEILN